MKIKMIVPKKAAETHDAGIPSSFEPFENERKSNEPEDVEKQSERARAEIQRRLKGIEKNALETKGKDFVGDEIRESLKNRNELAKLISSLKEQNIQYKISRSTVEGMRYDVSYRKLNEAFVDPFYRGIRSDTREGDVRPNEKQREAGEDWDWGEFEVDHGYGVFQDGEDEPAYIAKIDDMGVFENDEAAMEQAIKDGFKRFELNDAQIEWVKENTNADYMTIIDCESNHKILDGVKGEANVDESLTEAIKHNALDAEIRKLNAPDKDGERNFDFVVEEKDGMLRIYDKSEAYNADYVEEQNEMMAQLADEFGFTFKPAETDKIHDGIENALRKDGILTDDNVLEWEDNVVMSIAVPSKNEALFDARAIGLYYEYPEGSGCHVRETPRCFVAIDEHGATVGTSETRAGAEALLDAKCNESMCNEGHDEDDEQYIYLFPQDGMDERDIDAFDDYNLTYLGKNEFEDEDDRGHTWTEKNLVVVGTKANLERYADEYLAGYSLHPDYLYKEDDFAGEIIDEGKKDMCEVCPDCKKSPCVCEDKVLHESRGEHVDEQTGWLINGTLDEFDPKELIDAVKERKRNLHTNRITKDTDDHKVIYYIGLDLLGHDLDDADVWVDVVKSEYERGEDGELNETQDRVLMKNCGSEPDKWDKAIDVINEWRSGLKESIEEDKAIKGMKRSKLYDVKKSKKEPEQPKDEPKSEQKGDEKKGRSNELKSFLSKIAKLRKDVDAKKTSVVDVKGIAKKMNDEAKGKLNKDEYPIFEGRLKKLLAKIAGNIDDLDDLKRANEIVSKLKDKNESLENEMNEAQWKKVIDNHGLHQAIRDEDYDGIRDAALGIIRDVREFLDDEEESQDIIDGLEAAGSDEDEIDYWLGELYDLCDNVGVFIKLDYDVDESLKETDESKKEGLDDKKWYRGCEGVEFIWNGTQSDPELKYKDKIFNYWDVEDAMWEMFSDEEGSDVEDENAFNKYVQEHCKAYLDDWLAAGDMKFENLDESKEQELIDVIKYDYGMDDDEAQALANTLSDEAKAQLVKGWKEEARKEFGESKECGDCDEEDCDEYEREDKERAKYEDGLKEDLTIICGLDDYSPWAGAVDIWNEICDAGLRDNLEAVLEDAYPEGMTMTQLNDLLWFEPETVREWLGMDNDDEEEDEEEDEGE